MKSESATPITKVGIVFVAAGVVLHILTYTLNFGWGGATFAAFLMFIGGILAFAGEKPKEEAKPMSKGIALLISAILPTLSLAIYWVIITPFSTSP